MHLIIFFLQCLAGVTKIYVNKDHVALTQHLQVTVQRRVIERPDDLSDRSVLFLIPDS